MSTLLITTAAIVALLSVPTVAALTAWGLNGGDGEAENPLVGFLGLAVFIGSIYNVVTSFAAFSGLSAWRWWLMLLPTAAGLAGILLSSDLRRESVSDRLLAFLMQLALAIPALLVWAGEAAAP